MSQEIPEFQAHVRELVNQGLHFIGQGSIHPAISALQEACRLAKEGGLDDEQLQSSLSLSYCLLHTGERDRAAEILEEAGEVAARLGDQVGEGRCRLNQGALLRDSNPGKALERFRQAADLFERAGNLKGAGQALDNIGILYNSMGLLRQSTHYMIRASELFERSGELLEWAICQRAIGNLLTDMGDQGYEDPGWAYGKAHDFYDKACSAFTRAGAPLELAKTQDSLGLLLQSEGRFDEAIQLHERVIQQFQSSGWRPLLSSALLHLGIALQRKGQPEAALEAFLRARLVKQSIGDQPGLANMDHNEAEACMSLGRWEEARALYSSALVEKMGAVENVQDEELRVRLEEQIYRTWSGYLYASIKDCLALPEPAKLSRLLSDLERSKARTLKAQILNGLSGDPDMPKEDLDRLETEIELRRRIGSAAHERRYLQGLRRSGAISEADYSRRILPVSDEGREIFFRLEALRRSRPGEAGEDLLRSLSESDVLPEVFDSDALFMIDCLSRGEVAFLSVDRDGDKELSIVALADAERQSIQTWFERPPVRYRRGWDEWCSQLPRLAEHIGDLLSRSHFGRGMADGNRPLLLVPHGPLHLLPWEIARWGDSHLGLERPIARHFSAGLRRIVRSRNQVRWASVPRRSIIFVPEPDGLPGSLWEAEELAEVFRSCGVDAEIVLGAAVTKETFLEKLNGGDAPFVHFSGHCVFDQADSALSALVLSGNGGSGDPVLTAVEIQRRLRAAAPCVYLNCCDSGMAEMRGGDDALGLVRSFLLSGAANLILSSWPVLDESAPDLASEFYRRLLNGEPIAEALRQARRKVHTRAVEGKYRAREPLMHWGPFALHGDSQV